MRIFLVVLCTFLLENCVCAGTNDYWKVCLRACDQRGFLTQFDCECSTAPAASDSLDSYDCVVASVSSLCAWISCYDLGPGFGLGYCVDRRAPVEGSSKTWNLKLRVGANWSRPDVYLRVWNPAGAFDINGTIPISLKVASDPTGTYSPGHVLIPEWDPSKNGNMTAPAYTFVFDNAAALIGGAAIDLQLIAGSSDAIPCSIGEARQTYVGRLVAISSVTAMSGSSELAGLWVSSEGLPGLRVSPGLGVARGEVVDLTGIVVWMDGVPILSNAQIKARHGSAQPHKYVLPNHGLVNDRRETLNYTGINPVGVLCVVSGKVTATNTDSGVFYLEDGTGAADGLGPVNAPYRGVRVSCGTGVLLPNPGACVTVTGIRSVEKHVLEHDSPVNGEPRQAGETVYVPVILIREVQDILPIIP